LVAPQLFELREEDGHACVPNPDVPPELEELARLAVRSCPEEAIVADD
jgi:ferredoxin